MAARAGIVRTRPQGGRCELLFARTLPLAGRLHSNCSFRCFLGVDLSDSVEEPAPQQRATGSTRKRLVRRLYECGEFVRLPGRSTACELRFDRPPRLAGVAEDHHSSDWGVMAGLRNSRPEHP